MLSGAALMAASVAASRPGTPRSPTDFFPGLAHYGVNMAALDFAGVASNAQSPSQAEFDEMAERGFTRARIPWRWQFLQPELFGPLDTFFTAKIVTACQRAHAAGMQVMLDNHSFGGHQVYGKIGNGVVTGAHLGDVWQKLDAALAAAGVTVFSYDIMNEPSNMPDATAWEIGAQVAINMIREVNTQVVIVMEGNAFSGAWNWVNNNPTIHTVTDPAQRMVWSAHLYLDRDSSGTFFDYDTEVAAGSSAPVGVPIDDQIGIVRTSVFIDWLQDNGFYGHIGELGVPENDPRWQPLYYNTIEHCLANGVPVDAWAAGNWSDNYQLSVRPYRTAPQTGKQKRAVTTFTKFTGASQPTTLWSTVPTRGVAGQPVDVLVQYRGTRAQDITVTLSDNGAGGSFSVNPITLAVGDDPEETVTYTQAAEKRVTISMTNNRGLTNASDKLVSTVEDIFVQALAATEPRNVFSFWRIYTPYTGPCIRLQDEDGNQSDFGFDADGFLDRQAVADWAGGRRTYLHTWYDQSPNAGHMTRDNTSDRRTWAVFMLEDENGWPTVYWGNDAGTGRRMRFTSSIVGATGHTTLLSLRHLSGNHAVEWVFTSAYQPFYDGTNARIERRNPTVVTTLAHTVASNTYTNHAAQFVGGSALTLYKDGVQSGTTSMADYPTIEIENNEATCRVGWFRFSTSSNWTGYIREIIVYREALSEAAILNFQADQDARFGGTPTAFTYPADPTYTLTGLTLPSVYRGVNCSGWEGNGNLGFAPHDADLGYNFFPPDFLNSSGTTGGLTARLDYYQSKGMSIIRMPMKFQRWQYRPNGPLNNFYLDKLYTILQACGSRGMRLIIDPHDYANIYDHATDAFTKIDTAPKRAIFADFWSRMATAFKGCDNAVFCIMNEPNGITAADWKLAAVDAVDAIRLTGATNLVMVPGTSFTGAHSWVTSGNAAAWAGYSDTNFVYEMHQYLDGNNSGTQSTCTLGAGASRLDAATDWLRDEAQMAFLGEVGWTISSTCDPEAQAILQYMADNDDVWLGWAAWATGPGYSGSLSMEPGFTSGVPNADKPQMTLLVPYL